MAPNQFGIVHLAINSVILAQYSFKKSHQALFFLGVPRSFENVKFQGRQSSISGVCGRFFWCLNSLKKEVLGTQQYTGSRSTGVITALRRAL